MAFSEIIFIIFLIINLLPIPLKQSVRPYNFCLSIIVNSVLIEKIRLFSPMVVKLKLTGFFIAIIR